MTEKTTTTEKEVKPPKVKETPEQKAERIAAMTPEERAKYDAKVERMMAARKIKDAETEAKETPTLDPQIRRRYYC